MSEGFDFGQFEAFLKLDDKRALDMVTTSNSHCRSEGELGVISYFCKYGSDDVESLHRLLRCGASLELDSNGLRWNPLHVAAQRDKPKLVRALLDLGVPVNILTRYSSTPLWCSMDSGKMCTMILIDAGAQIVPIVPIWVRNFVATRKKIRSTALALLCVTRCGANTFGNGKDVFLIIARCVWGLRGIISETQTQ